MTGTLALTVLIAQAIGSIGMFGVLWTMQLVHYPLMRYIPADAFVDYESHHTRAITNVVGPLMAVEGICVLALFFARPDFIPLWLVLAGCFFESVVIGTTAFVSAPLHGRLEHGLDQSLLDRLIRTNWIRTIGWTARAAVAVAMLVLYVSR